MKHILAVIFYSFVFLGNAQQPNYNLNWGFSLGTFSEEYMSRVVLTPQGNLLMGGNFLGGLDFDPGAGVEIPMPSATNSWYVVEYDTLGAFNWVIVWDDLNAARCKFDIDLAGNIYMTGMTGGQYGTVHDFDPGPATYNISTPDICHLFKN